MSDKLSASEAVYGLLGWLTARSQSVRLGAQYDASIGAELAAKFCDANSLADPREGWNKNLKMPGKWCPCCKTVFERPVGTKGWKLDYCSVDCRKKHRRKLRNRRYYLRRKAEK